MKRAAMLLGVSMGLALNGCASTQHANQPAAPIETAQSENEPAPRQPEKERPTPLRDTAMWVGYVVLLPYIVVRQIIDPIKC